MIIQYIMKVILIKSPNVKKKFRAITPHKVIDFGANGYNDYTIYNKLEGRIIADKKKKAYLARHAKNENWLDPLTAGFWSKWILWNKPTIEESIRDTERIFNLKIDYRH
jgi:hypothetical protein